MNVGIECKESDCVQGIADLTVLFPVSHQSVRDMLFSIKPSAGILQLTLDDKLLWQGKNAGEVIAAFEYEFYNHVIGALYPPLLSLHASTVSINGTCITCAGISGAGKSSLCTEALLAGATYFSDEFTLLDTAGHIVPFPRPLQWGSEEHPAFSHEIMLKSGLFNKTSYRFPDRSGNTVTSLLWHPEHLAKVPEAMCIVLLPQYDATSSTAALTELRRSQGIMELAAHVHHNLPPTKRIHLLHKRVPDQATFYRLSFSDVHAAWKQIETLTGST
jgi:hypothetical protein